MISTPASRRASLSQSSTSSLSSRIAKAHQARMASRRFSLLSLSSHDTDANMESNEQYDSEASCSAAERTPMPRYSRQIDDRSSLASSSSISSLPYRAKSSTRDSTRSSSNSYRQSTLERSNSTIPDLRSELSRKVPFGFRRSSSAVSCNSFWYLEMKL